MHLNVEKTLDAISTLFRFHNTTEMSYLRLLKLLYIADRESIKETGRSITGDKVVAMANGPVLSGVYDLVKGEHGGFKEWSACFRKVGYKLEMTGDSGNRNLSKYEIAKLRELTARHEEDDAWDLVNVTHEFDEWKRNEPGKSCRPIPFDHIIEAVGRGADKEAIVQEADAMSAFDRLLEQASR